MFGNAYSPQIPNPPGRMLIKTLFYPSRLISTAVIAVSEAVGMDPSVCTNLILKMDFSRSW